MKYNDSLDCFIREDGKVVPLEETPRDEILNVLRYYREEANRYAAESHRYQRMVRGVRDFLREVTR